MIEPKTRINDDFDHVFDGEEMRQYDPECGSAHDHVMLDDRIAYFPVRCDSECEWFE